MYKIINFNKEKLLDNRVALMIIMIICLSVIISLISSEYMQMKNIHNIMSNNAIYGIMSIGITLILVTGNIDLSVGAQFAAVGMIVSSFSNYMEQNNIESIFLLILLSILSGSMLGFINGFLITKIKLPAIIVTLGTNSILRGLILQLTNGKWVNSIPKWYSNFYNTEIVNINIPIYIWFFLVVASIFMLKYTSFGRSIIALGGNRIGAIRIGINQDHILGSVFVLNGIMIGIASFLYVSQLGSAQPTVGSGYEMILIASAVIGGNKLSGGKASMLGTTLGIILLGIINNALVLTQTPIYWQNVVTGVIIITSIIIPYRQKKVG